MTIVSESPNIITTRLCVISSEKMNIKKEPAKIASSQKLNITKTSKNDQLLPTSR